MSISGPTTPGIASPAASALAAAAMRTLDCDVCVLGDDVAGLLIACDLASRGLEVALVPTLGRGAAPGVEPALGLDGTFAPGYGLSALALWEQLGQADAQDVLRLSVMAAQRGMALAEGAGVPLGEKGRLKVARAGAADHLRRDAAAFAELVPDACVLVDAADTQALLGTSTFTAALGVVPAHRVDVGAFRRVLEAAIPHCGLHVVPPVAELTVDSHGIRKYVTLPKMRVRATHLVFCGGAGVIRWAPELAPSLVPTPWVRGRVHVPGGESPYVGLAEEVGGTGLRWHRDGAQLSLAAETALPLPGRALAAYGLRRHLADVTSGPVRVESARAVTLSQTRRRMPLITEGEKGVWYCLTMGADELTHGVLAADLITTAIAERDDRIRLFEPFGLEARGVRPLSRWSRLVDYGRRGLQVAREAAPGAALPPADTAARRVLAAPRELARNLFARAPTVDAPRDPTGEI